jgi:exopolysaccharide biosynthesis predicted pyruvyltransferase EpsI
MRRDGSTWQSARDPRPTTMTSACVTNVKEYLRDTIPRGERVYYYPNPGNAGDALIAQAAFQLFDDLGIDYREIRDEAFDGTNKVILYPGGANLAAHNPQSTLARVLREQHGRCRRFIILPHTISGHATLLEKLGANVAIFVRERVSHEYVSHTCSGPEVYLGEDLAIHLDVGRLLEKKRRFLPVLRCAARTRRRLGLVRRLASALRAEVARPRGDRIVCMRTDVEKTPSSDDVENYDVSNIFRFGTTREGSLYSAWRMLSFLNHYARVKTNRLHVCIGAALLGKQVEFSANSYYKCRAVYEFSLKERFPNVVWSDAP